MYEHFHPFCSGLNVFGKISRRTTPIIKHVYSSLSGVANKPGVRGNIWPINVSVGMTQYQHGNHGSDEGFYHLFGVVTSG